MLHTKYLGVDSNLYGSVLVYLIDMKNAGQGRAEDRLAAIWAQIQERYRIRKSSCRFTALHVTMIRAGKGPFAHLRGKAAEIKGLGPVLLDLCGDGLLQDDVREEKLMIKCLQQSVLIDEILEHNKHLSALPAPQQALLQKTVIVFNRLLGALGAIFHVRGQGLFNFTIKNHCLHHIADDSGTISQQQFGLSWLRTICFALGNLWRAHLQALHLY